LSKIKTPCIAAGQSYAFIFGGGSSGFPEDLLGIAQAKGSNK